MEKFVLLSKTYQGLIIAGLSQVIPMVFKWVGIELLESESLQLAQWIVGGLGILWAGYGRNKATTAITFNPKAATTKGLTALLLIVFVGSTMFLQACASFREMSGPEQARTVVSNLTDAYQETLKEFSAYRNGLTDPGRRQLANDVVAPALRQVSDDLDVLRTAAIAYTAAEEDWEVEATNEAYQAALLAARKAMASASELYRALKAGGDDQ